MIRHPVIRQQKTTSFSCLAENQHENDEDVKLTSWDFLDIQRRSSSECTLIFLHVSRPFVRGGEGFGRLYPDGGVPLSRRKHDHLVQELVDTGQQVLSVLGLIRNVMKDLNTEGKGRGIQV